MITVMSRYTWVLGSTSSWRHTQHHLAFSILIRWWIGYHTHHALNHWSEPMLLPFEAMIVVVATLGSVEVLLGSEVAAEAVARKQGYTEAIVAQKRLRCLEAVVARKQKLGRWNAWKHSSALDQDRAWLTSCGWSSMCFTALQLQWSNCLTSCPCQASLLKRLGSSRAMCTPGMSSSESYSWQGSRQLQLAMLITCSRSVRLLRGRPEGSLSDRPDSIACCRHWLFR